MEPNRRELAPEVLMDPLLSLLEEAESVPLLISGSSMAPFLVHGRDTVYLSKITRPLKKGDMILFRRETGDWVLHRILKAEDGIYTLIGDAQTWTEQVAHCQVYALVSAVRRKGKLLRTGNFLWDFFEYLWLRMIPLRPGIMKLYGWLFRK